MLFGHLLDFLAQGVVVFPSLFRDIQALLGRGFGLPMGKIPPHVQSHQRAVFENRLAQYRKLAEKAN
jgi:hypothetical protein